jgi:hypothetical protein
MPTSRRAGPTGRRTSGIRRRMPCWKKTRAASCIHPCPHPASIPGEPSAASSLPQGSAAIESRDRLLFQARKAEDTWSPGKSIAHAEVIRGEATAGIGCPVHMIGAVVSPFVWRCFACATSSLGVGLLDLPGCGIDYLVSPSTKYTQVRILGWCRLPGRPWNVQETHAPERVGSDSLCISPILFLCQAVGSKAVCTSTAAPPMAN